MTKEIIIIFDANNSSKKGAYFEDLVNNIFRQQRYSIQGNVNVTGQEFDLICEHKDRNNEKILIECKAKEQLGAPDLNLFNFKVNHNRFTHGIFIYTKDFGHQAQGTINEWNEDSRYHNLSFWNGEKVIELLEESKQIAHFEFISKDYQLTKLILFFSYTGFFYVPLFSDTTQPKYFSILNAKNLNCIDDTARIDEIKKYIKDTEQLTFQSIEEKKNTTPVIVSQSIEIETIAEVSESESWYDLKPASNKFFVGREEYIKKVFDFFQNVLDKKTENRVIYIDGKSGWGKSSFLVALKGKCRNKFYKNKFYPYIVDSRSANSQSFISLAFNTMLKKAAKAKFIPQNLSAISIPSHFDILSAKETDELKKYLEENNKLLILVFDQFEDIFRKESILRSFFKLLTDINTHETNIVLGFSWKNETFISAEDKEISRILSQSKEHSSAISLHEFNYLESRKIISQLENSVDKKLDEEFKRRIIDNSQGFPWLVKKLCVHIYKEVDKGTSLDDLFLQDLNVEALFKKDEEGCNADELKALNYIAKRAHDNNMFDVIEVGGDISNEIITSLINKNLIIKTGTKYNIYWDIFRDYLVTREVPSVGETYLIRSQVNSVFDVLSLFENQQKMTLEEVADLTLHNVQTVNNLLRELRSIGLIKYQNEKYFLKDSSFETTEENFKNYLNNKLQKHSFYIALSKIKDKNITLSDLGNIIRKKVNTGKSYTEKTLLTYAQQFLNWLSFAEIYIGNLELELLQKVKNENTFTPQENPSKVIEFFATIQNDDEFSKEYSKKLYDLKSLGLIVHKRSKVKLTDNGEKAKKDRKLIFELALRSQKIQIAYQRYIENKQINPKDFKNKISDLLDNSTHKIYIQSTSRKLYEWAKLIDEHLGNKNIVDTNNK